MTKIERTVKALEAVQGEWQDITHNEHRHWWFVLAMFKFTQTLKETKNIARAELEAIAEYKREKTRYYGEV